MKLDEDQAFLAMFAFLEKQYVLGCEELGGILGSMSLLPDGKPADSALASDWQAAVEAAIEGKVQANMLLKGGEE